MKWWEMTSNCNCIFALDSQSDIVADKVFFSNNSNRFLTILNGNEKVRRSKMGGITRKTFEFISPIKSYSYDCLAIYKTNLLFDNPIVLPKNFTIILRCSVRDYTILLSNTSVNYGLTFGTGSSSDDNLWRFDGYTSGLEYNSNLKNISHKDIIQTVVLKGSLDLKDVDIFTDYGEYKIPIESTAFQKFLKNQEYSLIGHSISDSYWRPNLDIIAYGLFDKVFSEEEVSDVITQIENQFLLKEIITSVTNKSLYNLLTIGSSKNTTSYQPLNLLLSTVYKLPTDTVIITPTSGKEITYTETLSVLYKKVKDIFDIVLEEGNPIQTKLYLLEKNTNLLIKTTMSNKEGEFYFYNLSTDFEYVVTANDPKYQFQSIIKNYNK